MWSVIDESARRQWDYVPMASVGPLWFGMGPQGAGAVLEARGFTGALSPLRPEHGALTRAFFAQPEGWACTVHDCLPVPEWNLR